MNTTVVCPICSKDVSSHAINEHIDSSCSKHVEPSSQSSSGSFTSKTTPPLSKRKDASRFSSPVAPIFHTGPRKAQSRTYSPSTSTKRRLNNVDDIGSTPLLKKSKLSNFEAVAPLAERLRPQTLSEFVGQSHLTSQGSLLTETLIASSSMILWGPPGCGKTTLSRLIAKQTSGIFKELSATVVGVNDVRSILEDAKNILALSGRKTILFLDEIHRFNKSQQDVFLSYVEQGFIQLIGATTENPSFKLTGALLSRCRVFVLEKLTNEDVGTVLTNAIKHLSDNLDELHHSSTHSQLLGESLQNPDRIRVEGSSFPQLTAKIVTTIISLAAGDARTAISLLEIALKSPKDTAEDKLLSALKQSVIGSYDRSGESHYDMISALHKSVRGSQGSAAMYWLARMLSAGEDPLYIARRMVVCASEDIGLADNHALPMAMATLQACQMIGMPECRINLAHLVAYLSEAPKSTRAYEAYNRAEATAKLDPTIPVPMSMRNAPTQLMKELRYGDSYLYNPDYAHPVHNVYLPNQFRGEKFLKEVGDMSDKKWDEEALSVWEHETGNRWEGRPC